MLRTTAAIVLAVASLASFAAAAAQADTLALSGAAARPPAPVRR